LSKQLGSTILPGFIVITNFPRADPLFAALLGIVLFSEVVVPTASQVPGEDIIGERRVEVFTEELIVREILQLDSMVLPQPRYEEVLCENMLLAEQRTSKVVAPNTQISITKGE